MNITLLIVKLGGSGGLTLCGPTEDASLLGLSLTIPDLTSSLTFCCPTEDVSLLDFTLTSRNFKSIEMFSLLKLTSRLKLCGPTEDASLLDFTLTSLNFKSIEMFSLIQLISRLMLCGPTEDASLLDFTLTSPKFKLTIEMFPLIKLASSSPEKIRITMIFFNQFFEASFSGIPPYHGLLGKEEEEEQRTGWGENVNGGAI
jgi:hypothetical protein